MVVAEAHKHGIPVVLDLDDYLIGLPADHPDRKWSPFAFELPALLHAMMCVDAITVTTPTLKNVVDQYNKNVFVLPNFLDDSVWNFTTKPFRGKQSHVQIAFIGTPSHQPDLNGIADSLHILVEKFGEKISFLFYGPNIPDALIGLPNVHRKASMTYEYAQFAMDVRSVSADIAIAPLNDSLFNRCKSPIKYMEYAAMGMPCVYSNTSPYKEVIKDGINGYLADTAQDWVEKLSRLIDNRDLRNDILMNARVDIRSNWMLQDHAYLWQDCYNQIVDQGVQEYSENRAESLAIDQIAEQIEEQVQRQAENIANLNQSLQEVQVQYRDLKEAALREKILAAELLLAEKKHSQNLSKERDILKEEGDRKTSWLEELKSRNIDLESQLKAVVVESSNQIEIMQKEREALTSRNTGLTEENRILSLHLENTKREVADYLLSDSWRLTRPLRKLAKFLGRGK